MKYFFCCLSFIVLIFSLTACSAKQTPEQQAGIETHEWPASDASIHTAETRRLSGAVSAIAEINSDIVISRKRIDDVTLYEVYPVDGKNLPLLFLMHEHGGNKEQFVPESMNYARSGYFCVLFDLVGYGERITNSSVESIEAAVQATEDIDLLLEYYRLSPYADTDRFALYGQSMGGSAVWHYLACGRRTPAAVVVASGAADFLSISDMGSVKNGKEHEPQWTNAQYYSYCAKHNPVEHLQKLAAVPMLVFQGMLDSVISPKDTQHFESCVKGIDGNRAIFVYDQNAKHEASPAFLARIIPFLKQFIR